MLMFLRLTQWHEKLKSTKHPCCGLSAMHSMECCYCVGGVDHYVLFTHFRNLHHIDSKCVCISLRFSSSIYSLCACECEGVDYFS